jgi:K+-transporting ATPase ATPase C chain
MRSLVIYLKALLFFTVVTGIVYPLLITVIAQGVFPEKANGSMVIKEDRITGSELIGQQFESEKYFTSRPSAVSYSPMPSGGSNYGLTNSKLKQQVEERRQRFAEFNQLENGTNVPAEMLFASASGLDPHISKQAAMLQVKRIAQARNFSDSQKQKLSECVDNLTEGPQLRVLGEERVNVLLLNLEVDRIK